MSNIYITYPQKYFYRKTQRNQVSFAHMLLNPLGISPLLMCPIHLISCWPKEKGVAEDEMVRQHHRVNGHEAEHNPGDTEGQGNPVCCNPQGHKGWDMTKQLNSNNKYWILTAGRLDVMKLFHEGLSWDLLPQGSKNCLRSLEKCGANSRSN